MRLMGRILVMATLVLLGALLFQLARDALAEASLQARPSGRDYGAARPILVYQLVPQSTTFVFSRPQRRVRILTSAQLRRNGDPYYSMVVEGVGETGQTAWRREIYARSVRLFVRNQRGRAVPHAFTSGVDPLVPSASDFALIDFAEPVVALRLSEGRRGAGVAGILARVQEQRPISPRQLAIGWERLSKAEQATLADGNLLDPALISDAERSSLLRERWSPVGPAGVRGQDYFQTLLYERPGPVFGSSGRGQDWVK